MPDPSQREVDAAEGGAPAGDALGRACAAVESLWGDSSQAQAFVAALAERVGEGELDGLHVADLYGADRCARGEARAIAWFERTCIATLGPALGRIDPSPAFVDELRQRVREKLLVAVDPRAPRITEYAGRGPLGAWVRVVAVREALAARRRPGPAASADELLDVGASMTSPELGLVKEQYRVEFQRAFAEALAELSAEQRNLLRHHYLHGLTLDQLASLYEMHRSSVARRIAKTRSGLLSATRRALMTRLATSPADFEELMGLIASRIDLSIERHLAV